MLFPDMPKGISETARVVRPGGRMPMVAAISTLVEPVAAQPPDPRAAATLARYLAMRLRRELATAGLKDIKLVAMTEPLEFRTGKALWDWLTWSNPITETILGSLSLTHDERNLIQETLDRTVQERAGAQGVAILTSPINIGIGTK